MSRSKDYLFDDLLEDRARKQELRAEYQKSLEEIERVYIYRLPTRKARTRQGRRIFDNYWGFLCRQAIQAQGIDSVQINEGLFFKSAEDREAVRSEAQAQWDEFLERIEKQR
tara:strand:- start:442 stop:777 length:336 start_codon:yes stop_codon:yes gene_type:complete